MSQVKPLRKNAPKLQAVFVFPSDEGIDLEATAKKMMENQRCIDFLKATLGVEDDELLKKEFVAQQSRIAIYSTYAFCKYDDTLLVPNETGILKYHFDTISLKDLDILADNFEELKSVADSITKTDASNKELGELLLSLVKDKSLSKMITDVLKTVFQAKLLKVEGVDSDLTKEEIIESSIAGLQVEDMKALWYFTKAVIALNVSKKKISQS